MLRAQALVHQQLRLSLFDAIRRCLTGAAIPNPVS
jgi:hypothetical protein